VAADPVSWILIEKGWSVVGSDGEKIGRVDDVRGDEDADIFSGLRVLTGLVGKPKFVPSEAVATIVEGEVRLNLTRDEVERLHDDEHG
jgi:hypothetical protein